MQTEFNKTTAVRKGLHYWIYVNCKDRESNSSKDKIEGITSMNFKNIVLTILLTISLHENTVSQTDSSVLDFFPLHKGNFWQYRYRTGFSGQGWIVNMTSYGDTIMPNGLKYTLAYIAPHGPSGLKYYRIDSTYRIQEYYQFVGDTCGGYGNELCSFRLNEKDSVYWKLCYNIAENILAPVLRYMGIYQMEAFSAIRDIKLFRQYDKFYDPPSGDTVELYGATYMLMKGLGIFYTEWNDFRNATLSGAIINGVQYGTIVGIADKPKYNPTGFVLHQNYPNPFNNETLLSFTIEKSRNVKLEIYNSIGQLITILEDGILESGSHVRIFRGDNLPSGLYHARLISDDISTLKKMMYIK